MILLDATAVPADRGGVGRYVDEIVAALTHAGAAVTVVCQARDVDTFRAVGAEAVAAPRWAASTPGRLVWEQLGLPGLARRLGAAVIHSPHYTFPLLARTRRVVTVHDLTFFTLPEVHTRVKRAFFRTWLRLLARRRIPVIAPSAATADEFVRLVGADRARLAVCPWGYDAHTFHVPEADDVDAFSRETGAPDAGWVAFLGTLEPRKNVPALIRAFAGAVASVDDPPALLLAGGDGWDPQVDAALAAARADGADVRRLGYVPRAALAPLLGGALVVAYPSLGEGFGLPVLEAMACGACVLTTGRLSLPEVGGDAVAYAEPDPASIQEALTGLLADAEKRRRLGDAARARAAAFTWDAAARIHLDVYGVGE